MKKRIFSSFILAISSCCFFVGCHTVPYSGRWQMLLTSESEEIEMGKQAWTQVRGQNKISTNKTYNSAVKRVGKNIAEAADKPDYDWEFVVFENTEPNAFCLPGGKIAVYTGLFKYVANDAELAAVVGHEVAHAIARHGGERVSQAQVQAIGQEVVASMVTQHQDAFLAAYGVVSQVGVALPFSREHEYEADYLGLIFMAKAGYDPKYALTFWEKFSKLSQTGTLGEYFSTHPMGAKRLQQMEEKMPEAMHYYDKAKVKHGKGESY